MSGRLRAFAHLVVLALVLVGCKVDTRIGVTLHADGSGVVDIRVALDDEARRNLGVPLDESLVSEDLLDDGWVVEGPTPDGKFESLVLRREFQSVDEANRVLGDISTEGSPFENFFLTRETSFFRSKYSFSGSVDFQASLDAFADAEFLDSLQPGKEAGPLRQRIAELQDEAFPVAVAVRLPGSVHSNSVLQADNGAVWRPRISEGTVADLSVTGEVLNTARVGLIAGASVLAMALLAIAATRMVARRRSGVAPSG